MKAMDLVKRMKYSLGKKTVYTVREIVRHSSGCHVYATNGSRHSFTDWAMVTLVA
jgi:hypothetical protein